MEFKPIEKGKRVYQYIIDQIKMAIEEGQIQPGEKLPSERVLATNLRVSRTSVKEAITVLESAGIVTVRAGVGMFLCADSQSGLLDKLEKILGKKQSDFTNLIELRQAIEGDAAYYAACRITDDQKEKLTGIYEQLICSEKQAEVAIKEDYAFHEMIVKASNNPVMLEVMHSITEQIISGLQASRKHSIKDDLWNKAVLNEHENIFTAIMTKEPEQARTAMWEHHQGIKQRYIQSLP
ncbi:FadR/GntR family transcriptional regulator [Lentibacillus sp. N15]|uniref:FadR/GntR family transcriptional regulator n=1 Tax=Lentibacillus songyuanensis TaxID=3136161 RepID=UPI0031BA3106